MIARPEERLILSHCHTARQERGGKRPSGVTDCPRSRPELHNLSRGNSAGYRVTICSGKCGPWKRPIHKRRSVVLHGGLLLGWVHSAINSVSGDTRILFFCKPNELRCPLVKANA